MDTHDTKRIPPAKLCIAGTYIVIIVAVIFGLLGLTTYEIEAHYHIFHPNANQSDPGVAGSKKSPWLLIGLIALYPVLTIGGMLLGIPLMIYISDYTAFQALNLMKPQHVSMLYYRIYSTWAGAPNGKMNGKDL